MLRSHKDHHQELCPFPLTEQEAHTFHDMLPHHQMQEKLHF
jgi:hypothetical protein